MCGYNHVSLPLPIDVQHFVKGPVQLLRMQHHRFYLEHDKILRRCLAGRLPFPHVDSCSVWQYLQKEKGGIFMQSQLRQWGICLTILFNIVSCDFDSIRIPGSLPEVHNPFSQLMFSIFGGNVTTNLEEQHCLDLDGRAEMQGRTGRACFTVTKGSQSKNIMFYFPGTAEDVNSYNVFRNLRQYWHSKDFDAPVVITLDFDLAWFLIGKNESTSEHAGYKEIFFALLPFLEEKAKEYAGHELGGEHWALGRSQGGLNALKLWEYAKTEKPGYITKFAAVCPEMIELGPYASEVQTDAYAATHNAMGIFVRGIAKASFAYYFKTDDEYKAWAPVFHPEKYADLTEAVGFASCTRYDGGGSGIGLKNFYNGVKRKGGNFKFIFKEQGEHCMPMAEKEAAQHLSGEAVEGLVVAQ